MKRFSWMVAVAALASSAAAVKIKLAVPPFYLIPGSGPMGKGPDGNSILLDAPKGLILVDTGRHPEHAEKLLAYAKARGKPIAAIVNTHWHLDHTTGNYDIRTAYPKAQVYATTAIEGALKSFLNRGREQADERLGDPEAPAVVRAQLLRARYWLDNPDTLRPTIPVTKSGTMKIAGRKLEVHVAPFAATEGDLWLYVPGGGRAIGG